jgi:hypothetical protein
MIAGEPICDGETDRRTENAQSYHAEVGRVAAVGLRGRGFHHKATVLGVERRVPFRFRVELPQPILGNLKIVEDLVGTQ